MLNYLPNALLKNLGEIVKQILPPKPYKFCRTALPTLTSRTSALLVTLRSDAKIMRTYHLC